MQFMPDDISCMCHRTSAILSAKFTRPKIVMLENTAGNSYAYHIFVGVSYGKCDIKRRLHVLKSCDN